MAAGARSSAPARCVPPGPAGGSRGLRPSPRRLQEGVGPAFLRGENGPSVTLSLSVTMSTSRQPQMFKNSGAVGLRGVTCAQHCPQHLDASCLAAEHAHTQLTRPSSRLRVLLPLTVFPSGGQPLHGSRAPVMSTSCLPVSVPHRWSEPHPQHEPGLVRPGSRGRKCHLAPDTAWNVFTEWTDLGPDPLAQEGVTPHPPPGAGPGTACRSAPRASRAFAISEPAGARA